MKSNFTTPTAPQPKKPTSVLKLFQVPWTSAQTDTMIFKTKTAQETYFKNAYDYSLHLPDSTSNPDLCCAFTFNQCRPFRIGEPFAMHISVAAAMRCSYFSYYDEISKKTWYGFIRSAAWINRNLTLITYDVDPIQTYMFEAIIDSSKSGVVELPQCYVEREHTSTDNYFEHRIPENLVPYEVQPKKIINLFNELNGKQNDIKYYLIFSKYFLFNEDIGLAAGGTSSEMKYYPTHPPLRVVGKMYASSYYYVVPAAKLNSVFTYLQELASARTGLISGTHSANMENILSIVPCPSSWVETTSNPYTNMSDEELKALNDERYHYDKIEDCRTYCSDLWDKCEAWHWQLKSVITTTITIEVPTDYAAVHKKSYNNNTVAIQITNVKNGEPPLTLIQSGTTSFKLYVYPVITDTIQIVISSAPIDRWATGSTATTAKYLTVSEAMDSAYIVSDASIAMKQAENKALVNLGNTAITALVPSLQQVALTAYGLSHGVITTPQSSRYTSPLQTEAKMAKYARQDLEENIDVASNIDTAKWYPTTASMVSNYLSGTKAYSQLQDRAVNERLAATGNTAGKIMPKSAVATPKMNLGHIGIVYAVNAVAQVVNAAAANADAAQQVLSNAGSIISAQSNVLSSYLCNWPMIIITEPTEDAFEQIDDYFNMFGYKVNKLKVPELFGRQYWNYVKTNGLKIDPYAACPDDAKRAIETIFDNGIRLHHGTYRQKQKVADCKNVLETSSGAADTVTTNISDTRVLTHTPSSDDYEKLDLQDSNI